MKLLNFKSTIPTVRFVYNKLKNTIIWWYAHDMRVVLTNTIRLHIYVNKLNQQIKE